MVVMVQDNGTVCVVGKVSSQGSKQALRHGWDK